MSNIHASVKGDAAERALVSTSNDTLTFLHAKIPTAKVLRLVDGAWRREARESQPKHFSVETRSVASVDDILHWMRERAKSGRDILIHGAPKPGIDLTDVRRKLVNFDAVPRSYVIIDLDDVPGAPLDAAEAAAFARGLLPAEFHQAKCAWNATAGFGIDDKAKLRLVFWTDRKVTLPEVDAWLGSCEARPDRSIWRAVQPVYLGVEVIGGADPVPQRWGMLPGAKAVEVPAELEAKARTITARSTVLPPGVVANSPRMIEGAIMCLKSRTSERIEQAGRRNTFRLFADDCFDRALTEDVIVDLIEAWRLPDSDSEGNLASTLTDAGLSDRDARLMASTVRQHAETMTEAWDGEPLDVVDVEQQINDALNGRETPIGSAFRPELTFSAVPSPAEALATFDSAWRLDHDLEGARAALIDAAWNDLDDSAAEKVRDLTVDVADLPAVTRKLRKLFGLPDDSPATKKKHGSRYLREIIAQPRTPVVQIVKNVLTQGEIVVAVGAPGVGKTSALQHLLLSVAGGANFLGRRTKAGGALYIGSENPPEDARRLIAHIQRYGHDDRLPFSFLGRSVKLFHPDGTIMPDERDIIADARRMEADTGHRCRLIALDNMRRMIAPGSTSDESNVTIFMKCAERICDATGAAIVIVHHTIRDGSRFAGSGAIESFADSVWQFGEAGKNQRHRQISFVKLRLGDKRQVLNYAFGFEVVAHDDDGDAIHTVVTVDRDPSAALAPADLLADDDAPDLGDGHAVKAEPDGKEARARLMIEAAHELGADGREFTAGELVDLVNDKRKAADKTVAPMSKRWLSAVLAELVEAGTLSRRGERKTSRYVVNEAAA